MADPKDCNHSFFVALSVGVESEGTVHVVAVCTKCAKAVRHTFQVAKPKSPLLLESLQKAKEN